MIVDKILQGIPDKRQDKDTTSLKFKEDLIEFFYSNEWRDKVCLEVGTNRGYTTRILSFLFKKVISLEYDADLINFAKDINKDRDNIEFIQKDVYQSEWNFGGIDVVFIDCMHEYVNVMHDIKKSIELVKPHDELILVFDDYGLPKPPGRDKDVKDAVDQYLSEHPTFELVRYVGEEKGSDCRPGKLLKAEEGIICRYRNVSPQMFWRILDNKVYAVNEMGRLGFSESDGLRISDEYLNEQNFIVMRSCHGLGDWGIISAMPRLLKEKYPNCKVFVPSPKLLEKLFGKTSEWDSWSNPFSHVENIFLNNPYVDDFIDSFEGDIYHDHYRIYDLNNIDTPLIKQMLKFWQFSEDEMKDCMPELYWSDEEKKLGDEIINQYAANLEFACLLISDRYDYTMDKEMRAVMDENIPHFYWTERPIEQTSFSDIYRAMDLRHVPIRIQLYIKSQAKYNVGNQVGTSQLLVRYNPVHSIQRQFPLAHNFVDNENLISNEEKRLLLRGLPDKTESKTTTSLKFKGDFYDYFKGKSEDLSILEIGSSLGHSTKMLSSLFKRVIAVDNLEYRHQESKKLNPNDDNVEYIVMDVYSQTWSFKNIDAVFIDCVHDYPHVKSDINNSLKLLQSSGYLIFDDYGLFPEIKKAVDEYIVDGKLKIVEKIGHYKNAYYPTTQNKVLRDREGVICQVV